jgi:protein ImuB
LNNWPIDRLRRQRRQRRRDDAPPRDGACIEATPASPSFGAGRNTGDAGVAPTGSRRVRGRPTTDPPRQRRWNHQLWSEGPREQPALPPANTVATAIDTCARDVSGLGRSKLFMPARGTCMTPGVRAAGPSSVKPAPPPPRPKGVPAAQQHPPLVLTRTVASRQLIVAASGEASSSGVRVGMTLTEGRALCPGLTHAEHDPARDARGMEALARWMTRFTPVVALPHAPPSADAHGPPPPPPPPPDGHAIYLDVTGCERVFGGIGNIVRRVTDALAAMRVSAGVAVALTPGAAWAVASYGASGSVVADDQLRATLAPLPAAALRLQDEVLTSLHHLGLETIGHVMALPRDALPARFGPTLLMRLDQALGQFAEPLVPLRPHVPVEAAMEFDGVVESLEAIWMVLKELLRSIVADLLRRGCGARELELEFRRAYTPKVTRTVRLSWPSRSARQLFDLLRCAMETLESDVEFIGVTIRVPAFERVSEDQPSFVEDDAAAADDAKLDVLVTRLRTRLGEDVLAKPTLVESHLPERAFTWHGRPARVSDDPTGAGRPCHDERAVHRPLQLLPTPIEIGVMVSPSDDRDGRPILFRHDNEVHRLTHAVGPERIGGEWWRGHRRTRDYFDVEDADGKRFWIFRVNDSHRWFLHGTFS